MKQNRHSMMAKGIMVLLSLLVLVFVFTLAWFLSQDHPATANGLSLKTESGADFDVAIGFRSPETGDQYVLSDFISGDSGKIDFEKLYIPHTVQLENNLEIVNPVYSQSMDDADKKDMLSNFKAIDLTGDGVKLYRPEMIAKNRYINLDANHMSDDISDNSQYISFDLYVRSETRGMKVRLDNGSYVVSAAEVGDYDLDTLRSRIHSGDSTVSVDKIDNTKLAGADVTRKSKYGSFSEDSVVGAVRIAFTEYQETDNKRTFFGPEQTNYSLDPSKSLLWIPRSDIYLQDTDTAAANDWTLVTSHDIAVDSEKNWSSDNVTFYSVDEMNYGDSVTYENAAAVHKYYDIDKIGNTDKKSRFSTKSAVATIADAANTTIITLNDSISTTSDNKTYYYGKCHVNLWIEGCDAEARRAIDGGSFFFGFDLTGN